MSRVNHIQNQIKSLNPDELKLLRDWFAQYDAALWDQQIEEADEADFRERQAMTPEERVEVFLKLQQRSFRYGTDEKLARAYRVLTLEQS